MLRIGNVQPLKMLQTAINDFYLFLMFLCEQQQLVSDKIEATQEFFQIKKTCISATMTIE